MSLRPVSNPPNPWLSTAVEYLEEIPPARLEVYEDTTRSILSENDSPDLGFRYSVNPYRGCIHGCAYCLAGDTLIVMADGTTKPLVEVRVGDIVYGTERRGRYRRYVRTPVLAHWQTSKVAHRIRLEDGTELVASGDHRFLTSRGWKYVTGTEVGRARRPHLTLDDKLIGFGGVEGRGRGRDRDRDRELRVVAVEDTGIEMPLFDMTTGTGDFIANGVVSHNCYARPSHEYLSLGAGTDFERKITVKPEAARLLEEAFERPSWRGELIMFSGITDCYQPLEATYRLTRGCLEVCARYRNPVGIVTKGPLVERDIDVLQALSQVASCSITVSIPLWDAERARAIEPYVASPQRRMKTIERLAAAGLDVGVNLAPMIPGLGDEDIVRILEAAKEAGAKHAGFVFLRLPGSVKDVFEARVRETMPLRADRILARIRDARGGKLYDSTWGKRQTGEGPYAMQAGALFRATCRRLGLAHYDGEAMAGDDDDDAPSTFARPPKPGQQLKLL